MRSLPPIVAKLEGELIPLSLPCPAIDLIALASVVGNNERKLKKLVRNNPSLLIYGLSSYNTIAGQPPSTFRQLIGWLDVHLLESFTELPAGWSESESLAIDWEQQLPRSLEKLGRANNNRQLRKSLVSFLRGANKLKKSAAKNWIRQLVGRKLSVKPAYSTERANLWLESSLQKWQQDLPRIVDIESIFRFRQSSDISDAEFETRLLNEKLAAMKQLAYGASHEINNPLANISTRAQTLIADEQNPERRHKLTVIYEQALRAHEMISDMMLFAHPPRLELASTDVRLMIAKLVKELGPELDGFPATDLQMAQSPIELEVRVGPDVQQLVVDQTQVSVGIKALIRNSIEAIRSGGRPGKITVRVCHRRDQIWIMITDNGVGIPDEAARHLFDPFYSGREAGRGLGFGLSKAWRIAQLHGGKLRYDKNWSGNSEGDDALGARFILSLPLHETIGPRLSKISVA